MSGVVRPAPGGVGYIAEHAPLRTLIITAYRIKADQIMAAPGWIDTTLFDMDAKAARPSAIAELHTMLKNLLAERFRLQFHYEMKERPVYVLTVDRAAKNLTPHPPQSAADPTIARALEKPLHPKWTMTSVSMDYFAYGLDFVVDRPVIDHTGIKGDFDFTLKYTADLPPGISEKTIVNGEPLDTSGANIFEALREQLGLRLDPSQGPVQYMVIDHVERPSAN